MRACVPLLVALFGLALLAFGDEPRIRLPVASEGKASVDDGAAVVHLTAKGEVLVERDGKLAPVTLAKLADWLRAQRERFDAAQKAKGRPSTSTTPGGRAVSLLPVVLRADRDAPWQHVQLVLIECKEQDMHGTSLAVQGASGEGRLETPLPLDGGVVVVSNPVMEARITVRVSATKSGDSSIVTGATTTQYEIFAVTRRTGDRRAGRALAEPTKATDSEGGLRLLRECHKTVAAASGIDIVVGELKAGSAVSCGDAVAVLNEFRKIGVDRVEFLYTWRPPEGLRAQTPLPPPGE